MMRDTLSRQLWSSLRTWPRKPHKVVLGLNRRSRYWTPCWSRASRIWRSVNASAKGSPCSRAKRARTSCKVVMEKPKRSGSTRSDGSVAAVPAGKREKTRNSRTLAQRYKRQPDRRRHERGWLSRLTQHDYYRQLHLIPWPNRTPLSLQHSCDGRMALAQRFTVAFELSTTACFPAIPQLSSTLLRLS